MKLTRRKKRALIVAGTLFAVTVPSFAIFGLGDIVFDPSAYAEMLIQKSQQVEELAKLEAQLEKAIETAETLQKSYTTAMNTYNQVRSNAAHYGSKLGWLTSVQRLLKQSNVESRFGEADGFTQALNKVSSYAADVAWTSSQVRLSSNNLMSFMHGQATGGSAMRSQLAMIEASDAISPSCLSALGAYSQQRSDNSSAGDDLQNQQFDGGDDTNSEVEQLNLLNAGQSQQMSEILSQGALHSCIASQMTVANMQQRNAAAQDLNTWAFVKQQRAANPSYIDNSSYTWTHYIP